MGLMGRKRGRYERVRVSYPVPEDVKSLNFDLFVLDNEPKMNFRKSHYSIPLDWRCISYEEASKCISQLKNTNTCCEQKGKIDSVQKHRRPCTHGTLISVGT